LHDPTTGNLETSIAQAELEQQGEISGHGHGAISMMELGAANTNKHTATTKGDPVSYFYDAANQPAYITPPWAAPNRPTGPILPTTGAYPTARIFNANAIGNIVLGFIPPQPVFPMDQGLEESNTREGSNDYNYNSLTPTVFPRDMTDDEEHGVYGVPVYLEKHGQLHHKHGHRHKNHHQQLTRRQQQQQYLEEQQFHSSSRRQQHQHHHRLYTRAEDRGRAHTHDSSYLHSRTPTRYDPRPSSSQYPYHSYRTHSERMGPRNKYRYYK
jgi:hypothetical protein